MAKFYINPDNALEKKQKRHKILMLTLIACWSLTFFAIMIMFKNNYTQNRIYWIMSIVYVLLLILFHQIQKKYNIYSAGISGEKAAESVFHALPNSYSVIPNAKLMYDGKYGEMDFIIVGYSGIHIVEVKGHRGRITGRSCDKELTQTTTSRAGREYQKTFYNPIKQVSTHVYKLNGVLQQYDIHQHIYSYVYFSNDDVELSISNTSETPCYTAANKEDLLKQIQLIRGVRPLSTNSSEKIVSAILDNFKKSISLG